MQAQYSWTSSNAGKYVISFRESGFNQNNPGAFNITIDGNDNRSVPFASDGQYYWTFDAKANTTYQCDFEYLAETPKEFDLTISDLIVEQYDESKNYGTQIVRRFWHYYRSDLENTVNIDSYDNADSISFSVTYHSDNIYSTQIQHYVDIEAGKRYKLSFNANSDKLKSLASIWQDANQAAYNFTADNNYTIYIGGPFITGSAHINFMVEGFVDGTYTITDFKFEEVQ